MSEERAEYRTPGGDVARLRALYEQAQRHGRLEGQETLEFMERVISVVDALVREQRELTGAFWKMVDRTLQAQPAVRRRRSATPRPDLSPEEKRFDMFATFLARLGSALGNPPDPKDYIRSLLREAQQQGLDPKELYRVSASSRPEWWPPAPSWDEVKPD